jgi:hypothetical protein
MLTMMNLNERKNMSKAIRDILDATSLAQGFGKTSAATANVFKGINHRGTGNVVPANVDNQGLTFFTKPNLNLSYDNVRSVRRLSFLANAGERSLGAVIRCLLSPRVDSFIDGRWSLSRSGGDDVKDIRTPLVDDRYAFITPLSNLLISMSGWPDTNMDSFITNEGMRKEVTGWIESPPDNFSSFNLTTNFQNIDGDPITAMFAVWLEYAARVKDGTLNPYPQMILENEIDYNTRIYRIILDPTRTFVRKIADCGAAYPTVNPIGAAFNYNSESFFTEDTSQLSIDFQCFGVRYNDPITIYNFNRTVQTFNSSMKDSRRKDAMQKLTPQEKRLFNYRGYPRISENYELEWYVPKAEYQQVISMAGIDVPTNIGQVL